MKGLTEGFKKIVNKLNPMHLEKKVKTPELSRVDKIKAALKSQKSKSVVKHIASAAGGAGAVMGYNKLTKEKKSKK